MIEPEKDVLAIGSGGNFAKAAALALLKNSKLSVKEIVAEALTIAGDIDIYTNHNQVIEEV